MPDGQPSWKRDEISEELRDWEETHRHGERESLQAGEYRLQGDYLGLEDGRPGIGWSPFAGWMMPYQWQLAIYVVGLALLAVIVLGWRACVGEERINELRGQTGAPAADATGQQQP